MMFGSVLGHFGNPQNVKIDKTCVSDFNALFRGIEVAKNGFTPNGSILLHWTRNDVLECFQHFTNLRYVKRYKTFVSGVNALFRGTEVAKMVLHQILAFNSLGP
jgi:hypothetical protein